MGKMSPFMVFSILGDRLYSAFLRIVLLLKNVWEIRGSKFRMFSIILISGMDTWPDVLESQSIRTHVL